MLNTLLKSLFFDETLYGYAEIDEELKEQTGCKCALVTLLPFPDMEKNYRPDEFFEMSNELSNTHSNKLNEVKRYLEKYNIAYSSPPASPKNDGEYRTDFSYKWAAIHAGLGFIGKNDVFVHYKYGQRVRISCLLVDIDVPVIQHVLESKCGDCDLCVKACPYHNISGKQWSVSVRRDELVNFKLSAIKSRHYGEGKKYLCCYCMMACPWHSNH